MTLPPASSTEPINLNVFYRLLCEELNKTTAVLHAAHGMRQPANRIRSRRQNDRMKKDLQDLQDDS